MSGFRVVSTHERQADAYVVLRRFQANEPRARFDLRDVRRSQDIRTVNRWAVVRITEAEA